MDNAQLLRSIEQMFANMNTQFTRQLATVQETLTGQVEELRQEVAGVKVQVADLQQDVAGIKVQVADLQQDVAGVKGEVAGLRLDIAKLNETVQDNHAYTVSELSKVAKEVEDKVVVRIQDDVATLRKEVELFKGHVVDYSIDVNVVKSKIQYWCVSPCICSSYLLMCGVPLGSQCLHR